MTRCRLSVDKAARSFCAAEALTVEANPVKDRNAEERSPDRATPDTSTSTPATTCRIKGFGSTRRYRATFTMAAFVDPIAGRPPAAAE
jgi:hypothetical protein